MAKMHIASIIFTIDGEDVLILLFPIIICYLFMIHYVPENPKGKKKSSNKLLSVSAAPLD